MLSIIICSVNKALLSELETNINNTIGIPFELIAIDNSINPKGITSVYNEGIRRASNYFVCLIHEDIKFNTQNWGKILIDILKETNVGLVGVAGCAYKPKVPSGWGAQGLEDRLVKINLIQHYKHTNQIKTHHLLKKGNEKLAQVACVDGVFLASKKNILSEFPFDENLRGFHCYDIDLAIAINQKYQVFVTFEILLEHFSEGTFSKDWIESTLFIHKKWSHLLPLNTAQLNKKDLIICEKRTFRFISKLFSQYVPINIAYNALKLSALKELDYITYLKMYISLAKAYFIKVEN